ncbi:MAG: ABC transporter substrate-binding protein [Oceanobacter sp.]
MVDIKRRSFVKNSLLATSALAATGVTPLVQAGRSNTFKIGFVSPQTGPLAAFAESDQFILEQVKKLTAGGIMSGGKKFNVEVVYKDSQSNPNQAGNAASELILRDRCDLIVASSTPATTNPVADQCEVNGVPCITNDTPWQAHFFGRKGDPKVGFDWTYHYFWGLEDVIGSYTNMWQQLSTNKSVGALWPNDEDGNAWGHPELGFPSALNKNGFAFVDRGRFQSPINDFSSFISEFRKKDVEIVTGVIPPPDFANFWNQAGQQGFQPKIVTVGKATEFPQAIEAFGKRAEGLTVEVWWSPNHPFNSSLTGQSCGALTDAFVAGSGKPWSMPLGIKHSLFEVAIDVLKRAGSKDPMDIRDAIKATNLDTVMGNINFAKGPVPNIAKTPLVSGQWKRMGGKLDLAIVENSQAPMIPVQEELKAIKYS